MEKKTKKHKWFAWYPVTIGGRNVWFEVVYRQYEYAGSYGDNDSERWNAKYSLVEDV